MKPAINIKKEAMIPLYKPHVGRREIRAVWRVLKSRVLTRGKEVLKFEKEFAAFTKQKYAIAVNSGTSGLHLAVRALGWQQGDEAITTPFSFIASSNALLFEGVKPIFVDIDPRTLNIDVSKIEKKITKQTRGILLVHILGLPVDLDGIKKLKKKYNLQIIEDACEVIGRPDNVFKATKLGDFSVYSFHQNKQLTTAGEGGMITTNNHLLAQKCRSMREHGYSTKKKWLDNVILGYNYRLTEMQAAFGRAQLKYLDRILRKGEKTAQRYSQLLKEVKGITTPHSLSPGKRSWFTYFILFDKPSDRESVHQALTKADIGSSTNYFPPIYKFPMYKNYRTGVCPETEYISKRLLTLPLFYEISDQQIRKVVDIIKKIKYG
jgi:perosamine synthetase